MHKIGQRSRRMQIAGSPKDMLLQREGIHMVRMERLEAKISSVYTQNHRITELLNSGSWQGCRCFLVAGGPSLVDFDFHILDGEKTIGINRMLERYDFTLSYSMDVKLCGQLEQKLIDNYDNSKALSRWYNFPNPKIFLTPFSMHNFGKGIYLVRRLLEDIISVNLNQGIYGGTNSGFGALSLAIALGANPIYLLGYDMQTSAERTHSHTGYPKQKIANLQIKLNKYKEGFVRFAPRFAKQGIKIETLVRSKASETALTCFPIRKLDEVL